MNGKTFKLSPYTSSIEKDILIMSSFEDDDTVDADSYLDLLGFDDFSELTLNEKKVILWKFREISLGSEVEIRYTCDCGQVVETSLDASNFVKPGKRNDPDIKKLNIEVNDETLQNFVNLSQEELDELSLDKYESLLKAVKLNQHTFDFIKEAICPACGEDKLFNMGDLKYIIMSLSDETLGSIYKTYTHLTFNGNFSKSDIDKMYPFERSIFVGLLHNLLEKK